MNWSLFPISEQQFFPTLIFVYTMLQVAKVLSVFATFSRRGHQARRFALLLVFAGGSKMQYCKVLDHADPDLGVVLDHETDLT